MVMKYTGSQGKTCLISPLLNSFFSTFQRSISYCIYVCQSQDRNTDMKETNSMEHNGINRNNNGENIKKRKRHWFSILLYLYIHMFGLMGLYLLLTSVKWMTLFYFSFLVIFAYIGLTVGAHRLYAHQAFVASSQLRFFLVLGHTMAGVGTIYNWVLRHRLHHKYHNTDMDPFNHKKGFFYSHIFSNLQSTPVEVTELFKKGIDMRDVDSDRFVWMQQKFYLILFIVFGFILPINLPMVYWEESLLNAFLVIGITRLMITTHVAWLVNSALLVWGMNKGDRYPANDNSVFFITKSYWMNYHYIIPWDWRNDEFGSYESGFSTFMIKIWYEMGLIEIRQTTTTEDVRNALDEMATNNVSLTDTISLLKKKSKDDAYKQKLMCHS